MKLNFDTENISDVEPIEIEQDGANLHDVQNIVDEHTRTTTNDNSTAQQIESEEISSEKPDEGSNFISGKTLLFLVDTVIPIIIKYFGEKYKKDYIIDTDLLKLDIEEQNLLEPSADVVAKILFGSVGPVTQFVVGLTLIYASKLPEAIKKKDV